MVRAVGYCLRRVQRAGAAGFSNWKAEPGTLGENQNIHGGQRDYGAVWN
ncbi:MAG TPA: hypothetical protein VLS48_05495 [Anaerolineales bacterium]|nr:hypothetical protein [Anaerolineales bacterium]